MLDNLRVFILAAHEGSLSLAAKKLGISVPTASRRVNELEAHVGGEVFHRSNQGLRLTPMGQLYFQECSGFINDLVDRLNNLDRSMNSLEGVLKVFAPTNMGNGPLDDFWRSFTTEYPQIALKIRLVDPHVDSSTIDADIGIQSGFQAKSSYIQQELGSITPVLVASATCKTRIPRTINGLEKCRSIAAELFSDWTLKSKAGKELIIAKEHSHLCNDMNVTLNLVKGGAGISLLPLSLIYEDLQAGRLLQVLPEWSGVPRPIYCVWPVQRSLSIRATRFAECLRDYLTKQPWFKST